MDTQNFLGVQEIVMSFLVCRTKLEDLGTSPENKLASMMNDNQLRYTSSSGSHLISYILIQACGTQVVSRKLALVFRPISRNI